MLNIFYQKHKKRPFLAPLHAKNIHQSTPLDTADYIIDVRPGGGSKGGEIAVSGTPSEVMACAKSITGKYLAKRTTIKQHTSSSKANSMFSST